MPRNSAPRDRLPWDPQETDELAGLYAEARAAYDAWVPTHRGERRPALGIEGIAAALGRSPSSVIAHISRTGMSDPNAKLRSCLGPVCAGRKSFFSSSPGHRLCHFCERSELMRCA
jgi:hypothetical protein